MRESEWAVGVEESRLATPKLYRIYQLQCPTFAFCYICEEYEYKFFVPFFL